MPLHDLIVFDLDGTLSDPIEGIWACINYALEAADHRPVAREEVAKYIGPPLNETFETILPTASGPIIDLLVDRYRARYAAVGFTECTIYPGVTESLDFLASIGMPMAVCTSKRSDLACRVLEHLHIGEHFQFVDGGAIRQSKVQQLRCLYDAGKVTRRSLMIGDRAVDLTAGHACRMAAGAVLWGYGSRAELEAERPQYLFQEPSAWMDLENLPASNRT